MKNLFQVFSKKKKKVKSRQSAETAKVAGSVEAVLSAGNVAAMAVPVHLAVIMDGNGRWARQRGLPRQAGHRAGAENLKRLCRLCGRQGIKYLTVYAFSTENWSRPEAEVTALMNLFVEFFQRYDPELAEEGIRIRFTGDIAELPENVRRTVAEAESNSLERDRMQLIVALNYGGRREIVDACRKLAQEVKAGRLNPEDITEAKFAGALYLPDVPDPDLLIRPSGEKRLSNFLLYEAAYTEFHYDNVLWPDFDEDSFQRAMQAYAERDRRFGGLGIS
jgi:undecaprenyl diphosphate synthase